ncbi:MAG: ATPase [Acutalibacteraceae bacterium]|nr:ATPase [Acutalibacteraceae bacterium]
MNLEDLLDMIDELLDRGMKLPGGRAVVDGEKLRSILDDIHLNMPQEIKQARGIVADRTEIISNAKKEAESTIRTAEERAKALVAQEEISKLAQQRANEIVSQAQAKSKEMRKAAQDFVDDILKRADEGLTDNLAEIRKTRAALKPQANNQQ